MAILESPLSKYDCSYNYNAVILVLGIIHMLKKLSHGAVLFIVVRIRRQAGCLSLRKTYHEVLTNCVKQWTSSILSNIDGF